MQIDSNVSKIKLHRQGHLAQKILILDGISGTGKTMMGPILSSLDRVEIGRFEYIHEYLCALNEFGKINQDASEYLFKLLTDLSIYNVMISREVNFRYSDLSGIFNNPKKFQYLKRLFIKDGDAVPKRLELEKPILHLITHHSLGIMKPMFSALKERLFVVEMVRHPAYLFNHWFNVIDRFAADVREFSVCFSVDNGGPLPWFAYGWHDKYTQASPADKTVYVLDYLSRKALDTYESLDHNIKDNIIFVPFEKFVLNPHEYLNKIGNLLGTKVTNSTIKILKKENCPRKRVLDAPMKPIYERYGWRKNEAKKDEPADLKFKKEFVKEKVSSDGWKIFDKLSNEYEEKYGLWF